MPSSGTLDVVTYALHPHLIPHPLFLLALPHILFALIFFLFSYSHSMVSPLSSVSALPTQVFPPLCSPYSPVSTQPTPRLTISFPTPPLFRCCLEGGLSERGCSPSYFLVMQSSQIAASPPSKGATGEGKQEDLFGTFFFFLSLISSQSGLFPRRGCSSHLDNNVTGFEKYLFG